ncbi:hypothetical protein EBR96_09780 [bacterium]|nr:hypothetical protein [bacterium]
MNVSGSENSLRQAQTKAAMVATDAAIFTKALNDAHHQLNIVPAAAEASQMALAKKKEETSITRVQKTKEHDDEDETPSVYATVMALKKKIRLLSAAEQRGLGL